MDADDLDISGWRPTNAHVRVTAIGLLGLVLAMVFGRANTFVLAVPFVLIATWGQTRRPKTAPTTTVLLNQSTVREGTPVTLTTEVLHPGADTVVPVSTNDLWWRPEPSATEPPTSPGQPDFSRWRRSYRPLRWGHRAAPVPIVYALSPWLAFGAIAGVEGSASVLVTPRPEHFAPRASMPHPHGLVGLDRSTRRGSGSEMESIRPYRSGDRLHRMHWPTSLRTGTPHVAGTYSDEESHVLILLDNTTDIGAAHGGPDLPTSLDLTLRAAAALVSHHLARGDRVAVHTLGRSGVHLPPSMTGRTWIEPALAQLATCDRSAFDPAASRRMLARRPDSALLVVLSPLMHDDIRDAVAACVLHRLAIVVDTLPRHLGTRGSTSTDQAWRITRLRRDTTLEALIERGVPVVPWTGASSLDAVLRAIARRRPAGHLA